MKTLNLSRRQKALLGSTSTSLLFLAAILLFYIATPPISPASAYSIRVENNVDADSDIDSTPNIGDDGATSYTDAQALDGTDQEIVEGQGAGYVAGNNVEDFVDAVTNTQDPADLGSIGSLAELQDADSVTTALTEENVPSEGVDEWLENDNDAIDLSNADHVGSPATFFLEDQGDSAYLDLTKGGSYARWYSFDDTVGGAGTYTVNISIYVILGDGNDDIDWFIDTTGDDNSEYDGQFANPSSGNWYVLSVGDLSQADVNSARLQLTSIASQQHGDHEIDTARLGVSKAGGDNYRFDREFSWAALDNDETNEELCIKTGTIGTETLDIDVWTGSWTDIGTDIIDANDDTWVNISISTWLDSSAEYFRFEDATTSSDAAENTWNLDCVLIHVWTDAVLDYELQWEHQAQGMDDDKDSYALCVYGFSSDAEGIEIQMWNHGETTWDAALGTTIDTSEQWYNQSISDTYIDGSDQITWRYRGTSESGDTAQTTLSIDWSGISAWNFTIYDFLDTHNSLEYSPDTDYHALIDSPLSFTIESGVTYHVQIKGVDETGTPVTDEYVYFNTIDNYGTSTLLTTSYQTLYASQTAGTDTLYVYLWINTGWTAGDPVIPNGLLEYNVTLSIITA